MALSVRDLTKDWRPGDAERLARFFNRMGPGWPGGGWDRQTPEEAERQVREQHLLGAFVTEDGEAIASFCSLVARPDDANSAYVGLLTADGDYHGRGYGKAVLVAAVERVYQRGIPRVDLHTWPGNMKAVPLYKKSGFMWSPESGQWGVYMENFTPGARRLPVAAEYFRKHDWYQSLQRDLVLEPDERRRGTIRVYEYLWEEGGDRLRMVYDRQSWGLVELETNDFLVGCSLADEKLPAGLPQRITWTIVNHRREPLEVALIATADEGVKLDYRELLKVRDRAEVQAEFDIDPHIREKDKDPRAPAIRTDLLLNGIPGRLEAGFRAVQAVHFGLDGDGRGLRPGRAEPVVIQCRNELDRPLRAQVRMAASPGASLKARASSIELPAKGSAELPATLTAADPGAVSVTVRAQVRAGGRTIHPKQAELHAHVLGPGDATGHIERDRVVIESNTLRATIWRRGGWVNVGDKLRNRWHLVSLRPPQLGPPYAWDEFYQKPCEARIEEQVGRVTAVLTTESSLRPGVSIEQRISLSSLPLMAVQTTVINNASSRLRCSLRAGAFMQLHRALLAAPLDGSIVEGPSGGGGRSLDEHRLHESGEAWGEGWVAARERDGVTAGLLWDRAERIQFGEVTWPLPAIAPGRSAAASPMYLFVGDGGSFVVRRWWQMLFGERSDREERPASVRRPLEFGLSPRPTVVHGRRTEAHLEVAPVGRLEFDGRVEAALPEGLRAAPSRLEFTGAHQDRPARAKVTLSRAAALPEGGYFAECSARIDRAIYRDRQPVIVLGDRAKPVTATPAGDDGKLWRIENGTLALTIAPAFRGAAISLQRGGEELLRSAYPEARPFAWQNPWVGGIQPRLGGMSAAQLQRQRFTARPIRRRGAQKVLWQGVRVSCFPKEEPRREDRLTLDYLLAPGAGIFAIVLRLTHRIGTADWLDAAIELHPIIGGSALDAVVTSDLDPMTSRLQCDFGGDAGGGGWVVAENPRAGEAVVMACARGEANVTAEVFGRDGYCLTGWRGAVHEAGQTRESVFLVSFTAADRARSLAEALAALKELP